MPENQNPGIPDIDGPDMGIPGTEYVYILSSFDPYGDDVRYLIDWGDETIEITDYYPSGMDVIVKHTWEEEGIYTIKVQAEDFNGLYLESSYVTISDNIFQNTSLANPASDRFDYDGQIHLKGGGENQETVNITGNVFVIEVSSENLSLKGLRLLKSFTALLLDKSANIKPKLAGSLASSSKRSGPTSSCAINAIGASFPILTRNIILPL